MTQHKVIKLSNYRRTKMAKVFEKTSRAKAMEVISKMDKRDLAAGSFKAMVELQEALDNVAQIIQNKQPYLIASGFSMIVAAGSFGLPDVHNPEREEPDEDHGIVTTSFVVGSELNCIALTNIITAKIFDARNKKGGQ